MRPPSLPSPFLPQEQRITSAADLEIRWPKATGTTRQDEESYELKWGHGSWRRVRIHDYAAHYTTAGLYEHLTYQMLRCSSSEKIARKGADILREEFCSLRQRDGVDRSRADVVSNTVIELPPPTAHPLDHA